MTIADRSSRREALVILALTLLGAGLRFWSFGGLGLTHFDEGIYALAGLWSVSRGGLAALDPSLIPYAPPGFPILVGLSYLVFGVADGSAIVVSTVCGVVTIPVAGWLGRRTFGRGAGAAAAAFATMSMAHVAFSRKALTDAPFLLAWLVALGLGQRFLEAPRLGRAVAMGATVGLAQNLKYNGWLAGAVVILTAVLGLIVRREDRRPVAIARTFGFGLVGALVAALSYAPWYAFVERQEGGYAGLVRHHRGYLGGISSWYPHWQHQIAQVVALSGGIYWSFGTWVVAWVVAALAANGLALVDPPTRWGWARFRLGLLAGAVALAGIAALPWWAALVALPWLLIDARPAPRLVGVSWLVLSILTPFYYPYARLWLPLHAAGWLILAYAIIRLGPFARVRSESRRIAGSGRLGPEASEGVGAGVARVPLPDARAWEWPTEGDPPRPVLPADDLLPRPDRGPGQDLAPAGRPGCRAASSRAAGPGLLPRRTGGVPGPDRTDPGGCP